MKSQNSRSLSERYGPDYFHGQTSSYAREGYAAAHPDWNAWLDFLPLIHPPGLLIDLGCAYGYLPEEARRRGFPAFGLDISHYALSQEPRLRKWLAQAHLEFLPLSSGTVDFVTLFDVLEHLENPRRCLAEAVRILKPDGLLVGTTPDPIFFSQPEPTHCFERPPSFWIQALQELGLTVQFRFSVEAYNFQFLAARSGTETARKLALFQHDFFAALPDFVCTEGPLAAVPRSGWGPLHSGARRHMASPSSIYLLNLSPGPLQLRVRMKVSHSPECSALRIRLDSWVIAEIHLTPEQGRHFVECNELFLPRGGHHLFFDLFPGGPDVQVSDVEISGRPVSRHEMIQTLPFDLYQRYRLAGNVAAALRPESILDVGGLLGDRDGHLAASEDFLGHPTSLSVFSTDLRPCDHPAHAPADGLRQPFSDESFDLVVSLDVLEHLPAERRPAFLRELDRLARRWLLIGAPFQSAEVERVETELAGQLLASRRFLQEHRELGLPSLSLLEEYFSRERGYTLFVLPSGFVPRWKELQVLTHHFFQLRDYRIAHRFNRLCNRYSYPHDQYEPSYRKLVLVGKSPLQPSESRSLEQLVSQAPHPPVLSCQEQMAGDPLFASLIADTEKRLAERDRALTDVQFLVNARQEGLRLLQKELDETPVWKLAMRRFRKQRA